MLAALTCLLAPSKLQEKKRKEKKRLITDGFDSDKETLVMLKDVHYSYSNN